MGSESVQSLAARAKTEGWPAGWFEEVYAQANADADCIPWADRVPNPSLIGWSEGSNGAGRSALCVGCGLGDDAEELARRGFVVTAFDISPTAIAWCRERFKRTPVAYQVADATSLPAAWSGAFDFIFEAYTLQVLPPDIRQLVLAELARVLAPGGRLLIVARGRDLGSAPSAIPPWPLTRGELSAAMETSAVESSFEDYLDREEPPVRRFRVLYTRR